MTAQLHLFDPDDPSQGGLRLTAEESAALREEAAAAAKLDRLGARTARSRMRKGARMIRAEKYARDSEVRLYARARRVRDDEATVAGATDRLNQPADQPPHEDDQDRRGLGNLAYGAILIVLGLISVPVAYVVLEVLEEPMKLTLLLALLVDVVFLMDAHFTGVIAKKAHIAVDARMTLGPEYYTGWLLGILGVLLALAQGGVRYWYLQQTGDGNVLGIAFSTILILVTFVVALACAYSHHHARVGDLEKSRRGLGRSKWRSERASRRINKARKRLRTAHEGRRHLAEINVSKADRISRFHQRIALSGGYRITVADPVWLTHERLLATPQAGAMLQPLDADPSDRLPAV